MEKINKKIISLFLVLVMFLTSIPITVFSLDNEHKIETNWLGDGLKMNIEAGEYPYVFMIAQDPASGYYYYETSNHTVQLTGGGAVHLIPMVDTQKVVGEWTPDGIYNCGVSNYDVLYCCDAITGTADAAYYKRMNLEDSEYYSLEQARRLRAIVKNAYPYVSVEEAKAFLKEAGFEYADQLDRSELISATQGAIWSIANSDSADTFSYVITASTKQKLSWGGYFHDFSPEITNFTDSLTKKTKKAYTEIGNRVDALREFMLALDPVDAIDGQIVITELDVSKAKIEKTKDVYAVKLNVFLNQGADSDDNVMLNVYINDVQTDISIPVNEATEYTIEVTAKPNDRIRVVATGKQNLERGVYFYAPEPMDVNGDGIATSREVSQNLIGVAMGQTPVHAEKSYTVDIVNADLEINKVDSNGIALEGAKFAIYTEDGVQLDVKASDKNGRLVFTSLIPGKYYLKETAAPLGYLLLEDPIEVIVNDDGSLTFCGETIEGEKTYGDTVESDNFAVTAPDTTVALIPGNESSSYLEVIDSDNAARTIIAVRKVTAIMTEIKVDVKVENPEAEQIATINGKTFAESISLTVGRKIFDDIYKSAISFTLDAAITEEDHLTVTLTYVNAYENTQIIEANLTGDGALVAENGVYTIENLTVKSGAAFEFSLNVKGTQSLEGKSNSVDVTKSASITFAVDDTAKISFKRYIHSVEVENNLETISISGKKFWNDLNNRDGIRPDSITINLIANGKKIDTVKITEEDGWEYSFNNLPKYKDGKKVKYTVVELKVAGYSTTYSKTLEGFNIFNTYIPESTSVSGTKFWNDANDRDGIRPDSITVNLYADGKMIGSAKATKENGWKYSFTDLPKYNDGKLIVYTVAEEKVDGYVTAYTQTSNGYDITNTHIPEVTSVSGTKFWNDMDNRDGIRPDSITVNLYADGKKVDFVKVTEENGWKYSFTDLPKYNDGKLIIYTVAEEKVDGYVTAYTQTSNGYDITNTHTPESLSISGTKFWNDANDRDGIRPDSITVNLYADGEMIDSAKVTKENGWKYSFTDLPKYRDGKKIVYTINEDAVDGYSVAYEGYNIVNTHVPKTMIVFEGIKYLDGDVAEGFVFELSDANGNVLGTAVSGADGKFAFDTIVYTEEGVHQYFVREIAMENENIIYDISVYDILVTVIKVGDELKANPVIKKDQAIYTGVIEFNNETLYEFPDPPPPLDDIPETKDDISVMIMTVVCAIVVLGITFKSGRRKFNKS